MRRAIEKFMDAKKIKMANKLGTLNQERADEINRRIRLKYTMSDELAILRQRDIKPLEFEEYNQYVERVKSDVKREIDEIIGAGNRAF